MEAYWPVRGMSDIVTEHISMNWKVAVGGHHLYFFVIENMQKIQKKYSLYR